MDIAGHIKNSFLDFPGLISTVLFVPGCNMDCWYCHNKPLWREDNLLDPADIEAFLLSRKGFIDGVVISGGEPTLQPDLKEYIAYIKNLGYRVKLDTNGLKPDVVRGVMGDVDYIAMDIKAPPGQISRVVSFDIDEEKIWESADMLMAGDTDYEFRTTMMPLLTVDDIRRIAQRIKGAKKYALQQYRKTDEQGLYPEPLSESIVREAAKAAGKYIDDVIVRGI